jgi:hypothetical protein
MVSFTFCLKGKSQLSLSINQNEDYTKQHRWFQAVLPGVLGRWYRIVRLRFSSRGSKAWTLSSHWDTTGTKLWLGLSLVLVARSFMAFLVFEYLMFVSLGA